MVSSRFGRNFRVQLFGESHGVGVGCTIEGIPPGHQLSLALIRQRLNERKPSTKYGSGRQEEDQFELLSGFHYGRYLSEKELITTGDPLTALFLNTDFRREDYHAVVHQFRPGHADYTQYSKSKGYADLSGGGHHSGRLTAPLVFAGSIAETFLKYDKIEIESAIDWVGSGVKDEEDFLKRMAQARVNGDSVGAVIGVRVKGLDAGFGSPFFEALDANIAKAMVSIPGIKGVEFGDGFALGQAFGSDVLDLFQQDDLDRIVCSNNHNGGINGGISNGMDIVFRVVAKPTPSICKPMETLDFSTGKTATLTMTGRHDPCIAVRVVPVVRAMTAMVIYDEIRWREVVR